MNPTKEQHQIFCKSREKCDGDPGHDYTSFWGRKHGSYIESQNSPTLLKRARQVKSKVKSMLFISIGIKGTVHKEFILAGQTVNSA
jgi:hypothetical protein